MLLVKNGIFFIICFSSNKRVKIRFNNVLKRKQTFFHYQNKIFQTPKHCIFLKGLSHAFGKKQCQILLSLELVKLRLEKMRNNVSEKKETFFYYQNKHF